RRGQPFRADSVFVEGDVEPARAGRGLRRLVEPDGESAPPPPGRGLGGPRAPEAIPPVDDLVRVSLPACLQPTVTKQPATSLAALDGPLSALLAAPLPAPRDDLGVASASPTRKGTVDQPSAGQVRVYLGGPSMNPGGDVNI